MRKRKKYIGNLYAYPKKSKRGRRTVILGVFFAVLLAFAGYRWLTAPSPPEQVGQQEEEQREKRTEEPGIEERVVRHPRVALLAPLSGPFMHDGEMLRYGSELAWEELRSDGLQVELDFIDGMEERSDPVGIVRRLAADPDVVLLVAHLPVSILSEIVSVCDKSRLPLVVPANSHQALVDHPWVFPLLSSDASEGTFAAKVIRDWAGENGSAIAVYEPSPYGEILLEGFKDEAEKNGMRVHAVEFSNDASGMGSGLEDVVKTDPSAIWLCGPPLWGARVVSTLSERGYGGRFLVPQTYHAELLEDHFGRFLESLYIFRPVLMTENGNDPMAGFCQKFRERCWREPNWLSVLGYDAIQWAGKALMEDSVTRGGIRRFFLGHNSLERAYQGLSGPVYFDENGRSQHSLYVSVLRDGKYLPLSEL